MSTLSLPSYIAHALVRAPTYTAEPQAHEQRLAHNLDLGRRPSREFVKHSRSGGVLLRLSKQPEGASLPVYGRGDSVEGAVELAKPESVVGVEVKIEGTLKLQEVAEGGGTTHKLCLSTMSWHQDADEEHCRATVPFSIPLPETFADDKGEYPLPPTYEAHLSGMPGFTARIGYVVSVSVTKEHKLSLLPGHHGYTSTLSTSFVYYPRSRPARPLPTTFLVQPTPSLASPTNVPGWECFQSVLSSKSAGKQDILTRVYVPALRVFCMSQQIPFNLVLSSSAFSLAAYMPLGPATSTSYGAEKRATRVQLVRQTVVDVRNTVILGTKTDIWRTQAIGEGVFRRNGEGSDWISYTGEISPLPGIKIPSFKAGGFSVKDFIVLTVTPDPAKAPFSDLRLVVPVRLTTDPWDVRAEFSEPIVPEDLYRGLEYGFTD